MTRPVTFDVLGIPAPQGSKRAVQRGGAVALIEQSPGLKDWRQAVATVARTQREHLGETFDGPLSLLAQFRFPMPKGAGKAATAAGVRLKSTTPDLDKLIRAVGDALTTSGLIADDARIAVIFASKVQTTGWTGVRVTVSQADETGAHDAS